MSHDQQLAELGQQRFLTTLEVLHEALKAGADPDKVEHIAIKLGVARWMKKENRDGHLSRVEAPV